MLEKNERTPMAISIKWFIGVFMYIFLLYIPDILVYEKNINIDRKEENLHGIFMNQLVKVIFEVDNKKGR